MQIQKTQIQGFTNTIFFCLVTKAFTFPLGYIMIAHIKDNPKALLIYCQIKWYNRRGHNHTGDGNCFNMLCVFSEGFEHKKVSKQY